MPAFCNVQACVPSLTFMRNTTVEAGFGHELSCCGCTFHAAQVVMSVWTLEHISLGLTSPGDRLLSGLHYHRPAQLSRRPTAAAHTTGLGCDVPFWGVGLGRGGRFRRVLLSPPPAPPAEQIENDSIIKLHEYYEGTDGCSAVDRDWETKSDSTHQLSEIIDDFRLRLYPRPVLDDEIEMLV